MSLLADLFSRATDGVFAVDVEQRIVFWNAACEQLLGTRVEEAMGRACFDVVHACDVAGRPFCKPGCPMAGLAKGGSAIQLDPLRFDNGRGELRKFSVRTALVPSQRDNLWSVVHLLHPWETASVSQRTNGQPSSILPGSRSGKQTLLPGSLAPLTVRERGILRLLADGHTTSLIARQLCISIVTVRNHIQHLSEKLGVHSRLEAVAYAHRHDLV